MYRYTVSNALLWSQPPLAAASESAVISAHLNRSYPLGASVQAVLLSSARGEMAENERIPNELSLEYSKANAGCKKCGPHATKALAIFLNSRIATIVSTSILTVAAQLEISPISLGYQFGSLDVVSTTSPAKLPCSGKQGPSPAPRGRTIKDGDLRAVKLVRSHFHEGYDARYFHYECGLPCALWARASAPTASGVLYFGRV